MLDIWIKFGGSLLLAILLFINYIYHNDKYMITRVDSHKPSLVLYWLGWGLVSLSGVYAIQLFLYYVVA